MSASGGLRRALLRLREAGQDVYHQMRADFMPMETLDLHTFRGQGDLDKFQVTTDTVLGGKSTSSFTLKPYEGFTAGCFTGSIDFNHEDDLEGRGGFASFRTKPDERVRDLSAFEGVELRVKTDGRPYIANFKCAEHSPEQLWQSQILTPKPFTWTSVAIPFRDLRLTRRGRVELVQVELNRETVNGFGVLLADGRSGPFRFEVQYLRALKRVDPGQWQSLPERAFVEAGGGALPSPSPHQEGRRLQGGDPSTPQGTAASSGGGGGGGAPTSDGDSSPNYNIPPPSEKASREEWAAWYKKMRAAAKLETPSR